MRSLSMVIVCFLLSGCSAYKIWYGSDSPRLSYVSLTGILDAQGQVVDVKIQNKSTDGASTDTGSTDKKNQTHLGALIAWSPEFNAAFISRSGNGCIQPATYAKTNSASAEVPAGLISQGVASGALKGDFSQALEKLTSVSDQSTYLSIGVYGLCQMQANGGLTNDQLTALTKVLFEKAATIKGSSIEQIPSNPKVEVK